MTFEAADPAIGQLVNLLKEAKRASDSLRKPDDGQSCAVSFLVDTAADAASIPRNGSVEDAQEMLGLARSAVVAATMLVREVHDARNSHPTARN